MQTTFQALIDEEGARTANAQARLGRVVPLALHGIALLNSSVATIGKGQGLVAGLFFAIQKCVGLAYLSYVRAHTVQGELNCRQAIEYAVLAAYLSANPDVDVLIEGPQGWCFRDEQSIRVSANKWLTAYQPSLSEHLKAFKDAINASVAHGSAYSAHFTAEPSSWSADSEAFVGTFFDTVDTFTAQTYLMSFCRLVALTLEVLRAANSSTKLIVFHDDVEERVVRYAAAVDKFREEHARAHRARTA